MSGADDALNKRLPPEATAALEYAGQQSPVAERKCAVWNGQKLSFNTKQVGLNYCVEERLGWVGDDDAPVPISDLLEFKDATGELEFKDANSAFATWAKAVERDGIVGLLQMPAGDQLACLKDAQQPNRDGLAKLKRPPPSDGDGDGGRPAKKARGSQGSRLGSMASQSST